MVVMNELRQKLHDLTFDDALEQHVIRLEALQHTKPHTVKLVRIAEKRKDRYNCFMYALNVVGIKEIEDLLSTRIFTLKFGSEFMQDLFQKGLVSEDKHGTVAVYFDGPTPTHAGAVAKGRVTSKWGMGNLWEHEVWEVPSSYGNNVRFVRIADPKAITQAFQHFAENGGKTAETGAEQAGLSGA